MPLLTEALPSESIPPVPSISTIPTSSYSITATLPAWVTTLMPEDYPIDGLDETLHNDLRKRQGGPKVTNPPPATTVATQMSPITTYGPKMGWPQVVYTQLFVAVPDQWPSPSAGTIGLGTIQGTVGATSTQKKRYAGPEPTGQVLRIRGREVVVSG